MSLDDPTAERERPALESLTDLLARLETDPTPRDEHSYYDPFRALSRAHQERGIAVPPELVAEEIAFSVHAHNRQDLSTWGLYFGPLMSWATPSGESVDTPPLSMVTTDVLSYWRRRAAETQQPVMRARYADLLWEMPKRIEGAKPDAAMARVAIDAYLETVEGRRYAHKISAIDRAQRALGVALSLRDTARIEHARDVLIALEDEVVDEESLGLWGFCFDAFVEPPDKRIPLTDAQRNKLVDDLEARLARLAALPADQYHPVGAQSASLRLASYYRRVGRHHEVARVLRSYGEAVKKMRGIAPPILVSHSLEQLYNQFMAFGLRQDADALNEALRIAGEESLKEMKQVSVTVDAPPPEKIDAYFAHMLAGTAEAILVRVALHFVPDRDALEVELRELAQSAPLSFMITRSIKDDDGRTVAHVGSLESDLEGQLLSHISQNMQLTVPWLRETLARGVERQLLTPQSLLDFLFRSPLFPEKRRPIIEAGVRAYFAGDSMAAIHMLVPQVEQAVRQVATLVGAAVYAPRRGGGFHARTLDDLLRDAVITDVLTTKWVTYLRVLLTDARGWNVRNTVCHGLAPASALTMPIADRVLHAMLMLALMGE